MPTPTRFDPIPPPATYRPVADQSADWTGLIRVISGGQTGADQAGWRAAKAAGIPTGGWMPKGFLTEDGPRPEFAEMYGAEWFHASHPDRTAANVRDSDGTIWLGRVDSPGGKATMRAIRQVGRPCLIVADGVRPSHAADWIRSNRIEVLNVAGNRASTSPPDFGDRCEAFLARLFRLVAATA